MTSEAPYTFRPYTKEDLNFIFSSWGTSYYKFANYDKAVRPKDFHLFHKQIREKIMEKPTATAIVCVSKEDPNLILGWICVEQPPDTESIILHYIYVKETFKREGIAKELIEMTIPKDKKVLYSHRTDKGGKILDKHRPHNFHFTPHLI